MASSRLDASACASATVLDDGGMTVCRRMAYSPPSAHWDGKSATADVTPHRPAGCREASAALAAMPGSRHVPATTCRLVAAQRNFRSAMQTRRRTIPFGLPRAQGGTIWPHAALRYGDALGCREHRNDLRSRQDEFRQCRVACSATSCPCKMRQQQGAVAGQGPNAEGCVGFPPVRRHIRLLTSTPATMPGKGIDARLQAPQHTKKCEPLNFSECPQFWGRAGFLVVPNFVQST